MTQAKKIGVQTGPSNKKRTSLYLKVETGKIVKYMAFISETSQTEIIDIAVTNYQKKWEEENGPIPAKYLK